MGFIEYINEEGVPILGIKDLRDNLELEDIQSNPKWHWIITAGLKDAVIGKKGNKLVWYDGTWVLGQWDSRYAVWKKGTWKGGTDENNNARHNAPNKW